MINKLNKYLDQNGQRIVFYFIIYLIIIMSLYY